MDEREQSFRTDGGRMLPVWTMAGTDFFLDIRLNEFRERNDFSNRISLDSLLHEEHGMALFFDKQLKTVVLGEIDVSKLPDHIELVTIPPLADLDPVGAARHYGADPDILLDENGKGKSLEELTNQAKIFRQELLSKHGIAWAKDRNSQQKKAASKLLEKSKKQNDPEKGKRI